jgi:Na+/proline symporter
MIGAVNSAVIVGYGLLLLSVGLYYSRGNADSDAFFLGDRTLGTFRVFGSTFSTFFGTGLIFTLASFGYLYGVGAFGLMGAAVVGFLLLAWAAPHIKELSVKTDSITLPSLMNHRWSDHTMALAGFITVSLFTGTLAANFLVVGTLLRALVGIPSAIGIAIFALLVVLYTVLGGFRSVVWTDTVQLALIVIAIVLLLPMFAIVEIGPNVLESLPASHLDSIALPLPLLVAYLLIGVFAFFGSQDLFQRIYAAKGTTEARRGLLLFTAMLVVMGTAAVGLGIVARALLPNIPADQALIALSKAVTPAGLVGVVLLGFLALANSDADSQLLTASSNVTQDFAPYLLGDLSERKQGLVNRLTVIVIGTVALLAALGVSSLTVLFSALGSWFAILGFVVVVTLFWNRTTDGAAFAGLAVGFLAPTIFVLATGNFQAAPIIGLLPAAVVVSVLPLVSGRSHTSETLPAGSE